MFLGVPVVHLGRADVAGPRVPEGGRFLVDTRTWKTKTLASTRSQSRCPSGFATPPVHPGHAGYEMLPLACFEKSAGADATPKPHPPYIPPLVACDDSAHCSATSCMRFTIGSVAKSISFPTWSSPVASRWKRSPQGDALIVNHLRVLNEAYALLNIVAFARGVHPLTAYYQLCPLVGQFAFFGETRRAPNCRATIMTTSAAAYTVKKQIDLLLYDIREPDYKSRPFEGPPSVCRSRWKPTGWKTMQMYVGVKTPASQRMRGHVDQGPTRHEDR